MKKIEITVKKNGKKVLEYHLELRDYQTADGQTLKGLAYKSETLTGTGTKITADGYINGTLIYNSQNEQFGTFTRPPLELKKGETFTVNFNKTGAFDCECTNVYETSPPPVNAPAPPKPTPRGVKTREEIEWEMKQVEKLSLP